MNPLDSIIREEIRTRGPMRFDRFMELALYHPEHGYYAKPRKIGREGDFFTSVSVGPLFGQLLARQARQMAGLLDEPEFWIVEQGAHDGRLARDILEEARRWPEFFAKLRYLIIERSAAAREAQRQQLAEFAEKVSWLDDVRNHTGGKPAGVFLSNELVDAFPVRVVERESGQWKERRVSVDESDALTWVLSDIDDAALQQAAAGIPETKDGSRFEINLTARDWMREVSGFLWRGYVLTIDYGFPAPEFFADHRREGTLTCYREHRRGDNVLAAPGEQDITAHVEFTSLARAGEQGGLTTLALVDQQRFLTGVAHDEMAGIAKYEPSLTQQLQAWRTLTDPGFLGSKFQVLVQAKDAPDALDGLRFARRGGLD